LRIAAENEVDQRVRQQLALQTLINERRSELDKYINLSTPYNIFIYLHRFSFSIRFNLQLQALERIEAEQKSMLEKISSN